jgi:hypothetical protein
LQISTFQWLKITQGPSKDYNAVSNSSLTSGWVDLFEKNHADESS